MPPTTRNKLSELAIKGVKPKDKSCKLADGAGLFLVIEPNGKKWWKYRAIFAKKETSFSFGEYPSVTLSQARTERDKANSLIANNIDPAAIRRAAKATLSGEGSLEAVTREWHERFKPKWAASHAIALLSRFTRHVFPYIGARPVGEITAPEMLAVLRRIEKKAPETARQTKISCGQVFRYAVASGYAANDPTVALREALPPIVTKHMAAPTDPKDVAPLLRMLDGYQGSPVVCAALNLAPLVFVRPGELRQAEWKDIDLEQAEWRYLVSKTSTEHIVPLSRQAVEILQGLYPLTGMGKYVFPSARSMSDPMSNNAVNAAMRRMGIDTQNELTGHGFRAMARTILDEVLGYRPEIIEHQLAHAVKDPLGRAYNRTVHLPARKEMMQAWADYLDKLKVVAVITPHHATK
jgi:integrase